jgi:hypothetical protein
MFIINIAKDFTDAPGGRFIKDGPFSGEDFRERILIPKYDEALNSNDRILIDLDGCFGFPSSFLDEAFGGLARKKNNKDVLSIFEFKSEDEPSLINVIKKYVQEAF